MTSIALKYRIMQNRPGSGWYWDVVSKSREVIARGIADTHKEATTQAREVARVTESERRQRSA
jgi:hypothetical protein